MHGALAASTVPPLMFAARAPICAVVVVSCPLFARLMWNESTVDSARCTNTHSKCSAVIASQHPRGRELNGKEDVQISAERDFELII
jgi:hypothetical protein